MVGAFARTFTIIMTPAHTAVALALLAGAAAIQCPDASWFAFEDKCYSAPAGARVARGVRDDLRRLERVARPYRVAGRERFRALLSRR